MTRFRKKPLVVEAVTVDEAIRCATRQWEGLPVWLAEAYESGDVIFANRPARVLIRTLEGTMTAALGDWIIRGVTGELYGCRADIFHATYDEVAP